MPDSDENALRLFRRSIDNLGKKKKVRKGLGATKKKIQTDIIIVPIDPVTFQPDKKSTFYSVWQFFDDDTKVHSYCNGKQGLGASADFEAKHPRGPDGEFIKGSGSTDVEANKRANKANWRDDHRNDKHAEIKERFKLPPRKLTSKLHGPSWLIKVKKRNAQYGGRKRSILLFHMTFQASLGTSNLCSWVSLENQKRCTNSSCHATCSRVHFLKKSKKR